MLRGEEVDLAVMAGWPVSSAFVARRQGLGWVRIAPFGRGVRGQKLHGVAGGAHGVTLCGERFAIDYARRTAGEPSERCAVCMQREGQVREPQPQLPPKQRRESADWRIRARQRSREAARLTPDELAAPREERGNSVPTVSGGLPTLGRRR